MGTAAVAPMERLGLGLSGGGIRATLFHLGVLRRLAELDLLRQLSIISAISGGAQERPDEHLLSMNDVVRHDS